ncbi:hypothetical protein EVAR_89915_1 [Eumeta japonica]|uniref:Uncharacterized protein n=1 Tax=Eumeta variegata TaxID=151549 RepID=A0A4C1XLQ0_EUMVA|nr:hypothetical protein EVAR_89915_1 [Eumeta japonica]
MKKDVVITTKREAARKFREKLGSRCNQQSENDGVAFGIRKGRRDTYLDYLRSTGPDAHRNRHRTDHD